MPTHKSGSLLALLGALAISALPSTGSADFKICNATEEKLFINWVAPEPSCLLGYRYNHVLITPGSCSVLESGVSSAGKSFYYEARTQAGGNIWKGKEEIWLTNEPGKGCIPFVPCEMVKGQKTFCPGGTTYEMITVVPRSANHTETIEY